MGAGNDFLTLSNDANNPGTFTLDMTGYGGQGNDIMWMAAGDDVVFGDSGDDVVAGRVGDDTLGGKLGAGNDLFISLATGDNGEGWGGTKTDRVSGGTGNDVVSTWFGDDTIDGGSGGDALWGGAGVDTIVGGADGDILYGGSDDGDLLVGGDGSDYYYYYYARTDGIDRVDDQDTVAGGEGDNYILVFSGYDEAGQMPAGSGVFETDHDLYGNAGGDDMVQITLDPGGDGSTQYIMTILQGEGAGSQLYFDSDEISVIGLWNNDATGSTLVVTAYVWDPIDGRYEYQA